MRRYASILFLAVFVLVLSGMALAQEDREGCKDHPMFTRMENFYIDNCEEQKFDQIDFRDKKGKNIKVEGRLYKIYYVTKRGFTPPSALQVIRNYENAIKKLGSVP